jgi:secreted PhoX family phosphatase
MVDDDPISNTSNNLHFEDVVQQRLTRRDFLGGGLGVAAAASLGGVGSLLHAVPAEARGQQGPLLGFQGIPVSTADTVVVPDGYSWRVLMAWGDPISDGPEFKHDASNTADEQAQQWGMHNDGLVYFPIAGSRRGLLVQNHEYTDDALLFKDGIANWSEEKTNKSLNAHGVSVIEIAKVRDDGRDWSDDDDEDERRGHPRGRRGEWKTVRPSRFARRITGQTPIAFGGPAAGDPRLRTTLDPAGKVVLGTLNNCAMGFTPWGTYLACEENFNGYFNKTAANRSNLDIRYGIAPFGNPGANWWKTHPRFNADVEVNEPNRFGWVVEIDPFRPRSMPVKRTALGRLKHEGAWVQEARDGRIVVYMGDDERNEYIYRYVSADKWRRMILRGKNPLDEGILYVARFNADGTGNWLALTPDNPALKAAINPMTGQPGWTLQDILINTRAAADAVGATMMDRPEWIDTFPKALTAIATLTNNNRRGSTPASSNNPNGTTAAGSARPPVDAPNPRPINNFGHIITWSYYRDWTEPTFRWDIFALCGDPAANTGNPLADSTIVGDKYGSPDGIYVAPSGRLWIQTDVSTSTIDAGVYAGFGHNQMLCADPATRETRRFLVGPKQCEITGVFVTPDERTMFVGIQHPGEPNSELSDPANPRAVSTWPDAQENLDPNDATFGRPRSSCIVITKDDGGRIGS